MEDKELYSRFLNGDDASFEKIIIKYKTNLIYFINKYVKNIDSAEDIFEDTMMYILEHKNMYNFDYPFKSFLYTIAKSKSLDYLKHERIIESTSNKKFKDEQSIEEKVFAKFEYEEIRKLIDKLPEDYQMAIYLSQIEGFSYSETAKLMNKTEKQIKFLVHRARKKLKAIVKSEHQYNRQTRIAMIKKLQFKEGDIEVKQTSMLKILIIIIIAIIISSGIAYAGLTIYNEFIKKQEEVKSRGLFDLGDGQTYYEIDLMANDMIWNSSSRLYHKIIDNSNDYEKYKSRISEFPNVDEINFDENFVVVVANENIRQPHEKDLTIFNITADDNTIHIIMKQKENPNYSADNNIWYAIVDRTLLRENADVTIEQRKMNKNEFADIKELPQNYSVENAIQDGCIVLQNNKVVSNNIEKLDNFVKETQNNINSFIRIYTNYKRENIDEVRIKDVEYYNGIYYVRDCNLKDEEKLYYNSFTNKLKKTQNKLGTEYFWTSEDGMTGTTLIIIQE